MKDVLFLTAHQDDELITMSCGISEHVFAGCNVKVVCLTKGEKSGVKNILNNNDKCALYYRCNHNIKLSEAEFIIARDREQLHSCNHLGAELIINNKRMSDGETTVEEAKEIILDILKRNFLNYSIKTHSPYIGHKDHRNIGQACLELYNDGIITDLRFYIEPYELDDFKKLYPDKKYMKVSNLLWNNNIKKAIDEYKYYYKSKERYAIGYHSVKEYIDDFEKNMINYCHTP